MAIGDIRRTYTITTDAHTEDFNADGGSVLVALTSTAAFVEPVDLQTTIDGTNYFNVSYIERTSLLPSPSISSIVPTTTTKLYLMLGPLSQVRISCAGSTGGTLTVSYRTIQGLATPVNVFVTPDGDSLLNEVADTINVSIPTGTGLTGLDDLNTNLAAVLLELRRLARIGELMLGAEVMR